MSYTNPQTWLIDEIDFLPNNFLKDKKPDIGLFVAVEGQSTDDGRVFCNLFQEEETIHTYEKVLDAETVMNAIASFKSLSKDETYCSMCVENESEQGLAVWENGDNYILVAFASNQGPLDHIVNLLDKLSPSRKLNV